MERKVFDWGEDDLDELIEDINDRGKDIEEDYLDELLEDIQEEDKIKENINISDSNKDISDTNRINIDTKIDIKENEIEKDSIVDNKNEIKNDKINTDKNIKEEIEEKSEIEKLEEYQLKKIYNYYSEYEKIYLTERFWLTNLHKEICWRDCEKIFNEQAYKNEEVDNYDGIKSEVVIHNSGLTLEEFFRRKRAKKERNTIQNILYKESEEVKEKLYNSHEKVGKGLVRIRKSLYKESDVKIGNESEFVRRYKKASPFERNIARSLGISQSELNRLIGKNSNLSEREKAKLLSVGKYGITDRVINADGQKQKSFVNIGDITPLLFIDKVKVCTTRNLSYVMPKRGENNIHYQMKRLRVMGLVEHLIVYNSPGVWALTSLGAEYIGSEKSVITKKQATISALAERIYVNHVAANLYSGFINILNLEEYPCYNRINLLTQEKELGENIVMENEMTSEMKSVLYNLKGGFGIKDNYKGESTKILKEKWDVLWRKWELDGKPVHSPELDNKWLYILFADILGCEKKFIVPDIVVERPRNKDGSSNNIAVEVERANYDEKHYRDKLMIYKQDNKVFNKVIYVTASRRIANKISKIANEIGFDRYDIVPMQNRNGIVKVNQDHWSL
ncbi:MAG: hypothetical protein ACTTGJ_04320 [Clostridium sp.]